MKNNYLLISFAFLIISINSNAQLMGSFIDKRDGKTYKTVKIGKQTWMAENMAYKAVSGCWAYNNDQSKVSTFGYLYNWEIAKVTCPSGWHLPIRSEWQTLIDYLGSMAGVKLRSSKGWDNPNTGTNSVGFSAMPGGLRTSLKDFSLLGKCANWWSATAIDEMNAWSFYIDNGSHVVWENDSFMIYSGLSVRCLKD